MLYKHFSSMDDIAAAVAIDGFDELAVALARARSGAATPEQTLRQVAHAYIDFAQQNPALYDAMFTRATTLHFATADSAASVVGRLRRTPCGSHGGRP